MNSFPHNYDMHIYLYVCVCVCKNNPTVQVRDRKQVLIFYQTALGNKRFDKIPKRAHLPALCKLTFFQCVEVCISFSPSHFQHETLHSPTCLTQTDCLGNAPMLDPAVCVTVFVSTNNIWLDQACALFNLTLILLSLLSSMWL